ncbi:uncharacterized protein TEOVI_000064300 [Trypanosoma equiperdum]|uniref:Uncharacterized protein n=3 Tax=Trypanozoon TaxID=39700 RepID=C9ZQS7_TRYB9|nr:hypothetical protein, conserved [Trypanosoma brucei gambiense DAL972]RHW71755.1 hypothetical protein DPX39_060029000 [Trypanosoma brucei equiperdum]CBH11757.1 hypothetical protein, conserved [Trypanosoma brucei gambiense DAL972]SCU69086.1 hypothetical protein, conserved [Trypanosoma equiperdum]|eukprot:XP_011774042.1 hypothetical protein, conserved [Trypanosoma brucei gambiense DAL972]
MIRRLGSVSSTSSSSLCRAASVAMIPAAQSRAAVREFHSLYSLAASLVVCSGSVLCFASWANNICNVRKYGRWRFRNTIDDVIMVSDFKTARYIGGFIGFLFYWFIVGPRKYMYESNLADIPGNKRFGPF